MTVHRFCELSAVVCFGLAACGVPGPVNLLALGLVFSALVWWVV